MTNERDLQQHLLDEAIRQGIIDGCLRADGWVFLYIRDQAIRLTEGQLTAFLHGAVGLQHSSQAVSLKHRGSLRPGNAQLSA